MFLRTADTAVPFLNRTTFGGSQADIDAIVGQDAAVWVTNEFNKPATLFLSDVLAAAGEDSMGEFNFGPSDYWNKIATVDDQLRQRMVFALSQILVVSDVMDEGEYQPRNAHYKDILATNAFGNYRDLLEELTYSPAMANWLTYINNEKGDPATGRMPDENYARELLQLFTIGLVELNNDGTPKLDAQGQTIEMYDNTDIVGLARVFTGISWQGDNFGEERLSVDYKPLKVFPNFHSQLEKSFLGLTIPANTGPAESVDLALDQIFNHPNVGPFFSRQLIQRFTASSPHPTYVDRVATAFNNGTFVATNGQQFGTGQRGDLKATLAAVILDPSFFDLNNPAGESAGKIREPVLKFVHWTRAFDVSNIDSIDVFELFETGDPSFRLGQQPFRSPSVFNFYRPGYIAPGTETGVRGLTAPEFQLVNESSTSGFLNFMLQFVTERLDFFEGNSGYTPDYSDELVIAFDGPALIAHLDQLLTGNHLSDADKTEMIAVLATMRTRTDSPENESEDRLERVQVAILMLLNSSAYAVVQ